MALGETRLIAIAEDDPAIGDLMGQLSVGNGFSAAVLQNGEKFIDFVHARMGTSEAPSLLIVDFHMAEVDGMTAMRRIRLWEDLHSFRKIPAILTSADRKPPQGHEELFNAFLPKPFELDTFDTLIRTHSLPIPSPFL